MNLLVAAFGTWLGLLMDLIQLKSRLLPMGARPHLSLVRRSAQDAVDRFGPQPESSPEPGDQGALELRYKGDFFVFRKGNSVRRRGCHILKRAGAEKIRLCDCVQRTPRANMSVVYFRQGFIHRSLDCLGPFTHKSLLPCSKCDPFDYSLRNCA